MIANADPVTTPTHSYMAPFPPSRGKEKPGPGAACRRLWRALTNLGVHRQVRELLKFPALAEVSRSNPRFAFKYLTHDYLAEDSPQLNAPPASCITTAACTQRFQIPSPPGSGR